MKEILAAQAPSWLAQMPSLWTRSERSALEARGRATRERMLRELTLAVEAIAADAPLLLKLEDIHWSDASTLDWLAHVARRPEPARLMRAGDVPARGCGGHQGRPRRHRRGAGAARTVPGDFAPSARSRGDRDLSERAARRADGAAQLREIAPLLLERTGGNPLFMTSIVNQLAQQNALARTPGAIVSIPHDVRRFIDRQIDDLDDGDRNLLTAASVIRREFATAAVAAALEANVEQVEAACARLARQGVFIVKSGATVWPDGDAGGALRVPARSLSRAAVRPPAANPARLEACTGRPPARSRLGGRLDAIASELAEHFERGNEPVRAIPHHQRAAAKALRRSANDGGDRSPAARARRHRAHRR